MQVVCAFVATADVNEITALELTTCVLEAVAAPQVPPLVVKVRVAVPL